MKAAPWPRLLPAVLLWPFTPPTTMTTASTGLTWYLNQAGRYPLLTPSQELTLGRQVRDWQDHADPPHDVVRRGQRARDRFVRANLRLVVAVAGRYRSVPSQYSDDLIQAGNLGLIRAVERFDPARGYKIGRAHV